MVGGIKTARNPADPHDAESIPGARCVATGINPCPTTSFYLNRKTSAGRFPEPERLFHRAKILFFRQLQPFAALHRKRTPDEPICLPARKARIDREGKRRFWRLTVNGQCAEARAASRPSIGSDSRKDGGKRPGTPGQQKRRFDRDQIVSAHRKPDFTTSARYPSRNRHTGPISEKYPTSSLPS